jgi:GTPase SAR1 family protein
MSVTNSTLSKYFFPATAKGMATVANSSQPNPTIHYKLVLLGDASVGKSCLVVRYVHLD